MLLKNFLRLRLPLSLDASINFGHSKAAIRNPGVTDLDAFNLLSVLISAACRNLKPNEFST
jgi:hypothetical protein